MFTGLIIEQGLVTHISKNTLGMELTIKANKVLHNAIVGSSIACDGVCLTAKQISSTSFTADVMKETIDITTLCNFKVGQKVNLEPSLKLNQGLDGHLVLGDVETKAKIVSILQDGFAKRYGFILDSKFMNYIILKGRVAIDGASLTITKVTSNSFEVSLIPHTQEILHISSKKIGDFVNIETDFLLKRNNINNEEKPSKKMLTKAFLSENGFL